MKKVILGIGLSAICLAGFSTTVEADSIAGAGNYFGEAWERYVSGDSQRAGLTYGYNTAWINEDYAWAKHSSKRHYAQIGNGAGNHFGSEVAAGGTSKIEVVHSGSVVAYACHWT